VLSEPDPAPRERAKVYRAGREDMREKRASRGTLIEQKTVQERPPEVVDPSRRGGRERHDAQPAAARTARAAQREGPYQNPSETFRFHRFQADR